MRTAIVISLILLAALLPLPAIVVPTVAVIAELIAVAVLSVIAIAEPRLSPLTAPVLLRAPPSR